MNRATIIEERTAAILASDPKLVTWERKASYGALYRFMRAVGHWTYLLTIGEYREAL